MDVNSVPPARLYGLPEPGQTDISSLLGVRRESAIWFEVRFLGYSRGL
jgi:hypothetical protein